MDEKQTQLAGLSSSSPARTSCHPLIGQGRAEASSSGAIVALELLQWHAGLIDFLVANEPPLAYALRDSWAEETIAAYTAVNEHIAELVELKDKFVMNVGDKCDIPSCNISTILASEVGVDLCVTPGGHLGYVSEPEDFARKLLSIFAAHGKA